MNSKTFDTIFPADSVEFCPHPNHSDIFVCGTYKLDDSPSLLATTDDETSSISILQTRRGQCLVFEVDSSTGQGLYVIVVPIKSEHRMTKVYQPPNPSGRFTCSPGYEMVCTGDS